MCNTVTTDSTMQATTTCTCPCNCAAKRQPAVTAGDFQAALRIGCYLSMPQAFARQLVLVYDDTQGVYQGLCEAFAYADLLQVTDVEWEPTAPATVLVKVVDPSYPSASDYLRFYADADGLALATEMGSHQVCAAELADTTGQR